MDDARRRAEEIVEYICQWVETAGHLEGRRGQRNLSFSLIVDKDGNQEPALERIRREVAVKVADAVAQAVKPWKDQEPLTIAHLTQQAEEIAHWKWKAMQNAEEIARLIANAEACTSAQCTNEKNVAREGTRLANEEIARLRQLAHVSEEGTTAQAVKDRDAAQNDRSWFYAKILRYKATVQAQTEEIERLTKERNRSVDYSMYIYRCIDDLVAERSRLRAALQRYGQHPMTCAYWTNPNARSAYKCDCGLEALRAGAETSTQTGETK